MNFAAVHFCEAVLQVTLAVRELLMNLFIRSRLRFVLGVRRSFGYQPFSATTYIAICGVFLYSCWLVNYFHFQTLAKYSQMQGEMRDS